eukprot:gene11125-11279_t
MHETVASVATTVYYKLTGSVSQLPREGLTTTRMRNSASGFASAFKIDTASYPVSNILVWVHSYSTSSKRRSLLQPGQAVELVLGFGLVSAPNLPSNITAMSQEPGNSGTLALQLYVFAFQQSPGVYVSLTDISGASLGSPAAMLGCLMQPPVLEAGRWTGDCTGRGAGTSCSGTCFVGYVGSPTSLCISTTWAPIANNCRRKGSSFCPVENCDTQDPSACSNVRGLWRCNKCEAPWVPNKKKLECVCPAGRFPAADGSCRLCTEGSYCPPRTSALEDTTTPCPGNLASKAGAASLDDCVNPPGFFYIRSSSKGARAVPCPANSFSLGYDRRPSCRPCPTNYKTDPDNAAGSHTSAAVCVAPPGYYVTGETLASCPQGSYQDQYGLVENCTSCAAAFGTAAEPGYMLLTSGGKAVWTSNGAGLVGPVVVTGARDCPQGYVCLGGSPLTSSHQNITVRVNSSSATLTLTSKAPGIPQACPNGLTTALEGAFSFEQCAAPPGKWGDISTAGGPQHCPSGTYKAVFGRASFPSQGCVPCGTGLWLSDKNYMMAYTDLYGNLLRQELVRGSTDSCCECLTSRG